MGEDSEGLEKPVRPEGVEPPTLRSVAIFEREAPSKEDFLPFENHPSLNGSQERLRMIFLRSSGDPTSSAPFILITIRNVMGF